MAINFPDRPTDGQTYADAGTGQTWTYELATNSWTASSLAVTGGVVYKGSVDITAAPPTGAKAGDQWSVGTGGTANAGYGPGVTGAITKGSLVMYTGSDWLEVSHSVFKDGLDRKVDLAGDTMTGNLTVPSLNGGPLAGFRNVLINGTLAINQRGVTIGAAAPGTYGPDRWKKIGGGSMTQIVEAGNFEPGATYTLSGTGLTTQQLTAPVTGNWTIPHITPAATKIQLELGTVATPFERRPIGLELALCQRYFHRCSGNNGGGYGYKYYPASGNALFNSSIEYPVQMRTNPTLTWDSPILENCTLSTNLVSTTGVTLRVNPIGAGTFRARDGILSFDAEL